MLDDLERGMRSELPWLCGRVAELGRKHSLQRLKTAELTTPGCVGVSVEADRLSFLWPRPCASQASSRVPAGRPKSCFLKPTLGDLLQPRKSK